MEGFLVDDAERRCRNCEKRMPAKGEFCPHCGQKYTTGRIRLKDILVDMLDTIFNIENRTIKTFAALFVPGRLTIEFFKGKHQTYFRPLRIFLVMAILHFAVISFVLNEIMEAGERQLVADQYEYDHFYDFNLKIDSIQPALETYYNQNHATTGLAIDSLQKRLRAEVRDSITINLAEIFGPSVDTGELMIAKKDLTSMKTAKILDTYGIEKYPDRLLIAQGIKVYKNPGGLMRFVLGNLTWMMLLLMPALAFGLKLLYIRRDYYYVEHLIFSFHYHAFAFLIASIAYLFVEQYPVGVAWAFGLIFLYLFIAMKRVYGQGIIKTFFKFWALNTMYLFVFTIFILFLLLVSALLY